MGYTKHHAMIIHGRGDGTWKGLNKPDAVPDRMSPIEAAYACACALKPTLKGTTAFTLAHVSELSPSMVNAERSFFIAPDGSKDGWAESDTGDRFRNDLINWLYQHCQYESGSWAVTWVEVVTKEDDHVPRVERASR